MGHDKSKVLGKIAIRRIPVPRASVAEELAPTIVSSLPPPVATTESLAPPPVAPESVSADATDSERDLEILRSLSERFGTPAIDLHQVCIRLCDLDLVPRDVAESKLVLPVLCTDDRLFLAAATPDDIKTLEDIEFITARRVFAYIAHRPYLQQTIATAYDAHARGAPFYVGPRCPLEVQRRRGAIGAPPPPSFPVVSTGDPAPHGSIAPPALEAMAQRDELSYADFGNLNSEVSVVAPLAETSTVPDKKVHRARILLVIEQSSERAQLHQILLSAGYQVTQASNGLDALRRVKAESPDVLFFDMILPEVRGSEIARRMRRSTKYGGIPLVMLIPNEGATNSVRTMQETHMVDAYIERPFDGHAVLKTLARVYDNDRGTSALPSKSFHPPTLIDTNELSSEAENCLHRGIEAYRRGDIEKAINQLRHGLSIDPLAFRLHVHLGLLYGKKGMFFEAIDELERALELNETHFPALKNLAVLYQKIGFRSKAVETWKRSLRVAPDESVSRHIKERILDLL